MDVAQEIAAGLKPLFEETRKTGKWLHCTYQDLWFSPDELEKEQSEGRFRCGAVNWTLRPPEEMLAQAKKRLDDARDEYIRLCKRVGHG